MFERTRRTKLRCLSAATAATFIVAALATAAPAASNDHSGFDKGILVGGSPRPLVDSSMNYNDVAQLTLPVVPDDMLQEAGQLAEQFGQDPQVASVGIALDRSEIEVYWYGAATPKFEEAISTFDSSVAVLPSSYSPALLREKAKQLMSGAAGIAVASAGPKADGSGIDVSLAPVEALKTGSLTGVPDLKQIVRDFAEIPVTFEESPAAAETRRQSDTGHFGGARIYRYTGGTTGPITITGACSTAFAVHRVDTGKKGVMTAAHCGASGSTWAIPHQTIANSYYFYGTVVNRNELADAAVIDTTTSYPYMYTSTWDSNVYTEINGLRSPVVGTEICYSGSYSGLVCGNIVTKAEENYTMSLPGGGTQTVKAFQTVHRAGTPAAGNGDSGGPGYILTSTTAGYKRHAATIISGIQNGTAACMGVAGSTEPGGRKCSATVLSTSMAGGLGATGWNLQIINP